MKKITFLLLLIPFIIGADYAKRYPNDTAMQVYTPANPQTESDPLSWSKASDQTLLTGDKSGSFDLTTSGTLGAGATTVTTLAVNSDTNISGNRHHKVISIVNPNAVVTASTIIPVFAETDAALTITKIRVTTSSASYEVAGDLKYADARKGLANAVVINVFDTTSGDLTDTSITSGAVASGKFVYLSFDSVPNALMTDVIIEIWWDYD
jgi:hypothetical protein